MSVISPYNFRGGCPDPGSFPVAHLIEGASRRLAAEGRDLVLYPDPQGYPPLRQIAADRFEHREGVCLPIESIVLTGGSMQALALIIEALTKPADTVITEAFSYAGTLKLLRRYDLRIVGIETDDGGMDLDALERQLKALDNRGTPPRFIYTIATYQNPTGAILARPRRQRLLEISRAFNVPIIEDNCYADLHLDGDHPPPAMRALPGGAEVIYVASFSKILGPGARLGYMSAPQPFVKRVLELKIDGGTNALASMILADYFERHLWDHVSEVCGVLRHKRYAVLAALERHLRDLCVWSKPAGGMFIWVGLPPQIDVHALARQAEAENVVYGRGRDFDSGDRDIAYLRLSFGYPKLEDIPIGIERLARAVRAAVPGRSNSRSGSCARSDSSSRLT